MTAIRHQHIIAQPANRQVVVVVRAEERGDDMAAKPGPSGRSRE